MKPIDALEEFLRANNHKNPYQIITPTYYQTSRIWVRHKKSPVCLEFSIDSKLNLSSVLRVNSTITNLIGDDYSRIWDLSGERRHGSLNDPNSLETLKKVLYKFQCSDPKPWLAFAMKMSNGRMSLLRRCYELLFL